MAKKGIGDLVASLNAKAAAAGEDLRAVHVTIDATWGDNCGIAILGTGNRERAMKYVRAYYTKHIAPRRDYNSQYRCDDMGDVGMFQAQAFGSEPRPEIARRYGKEPTFTGRVVSLVYYPCAE